MVRDLDVEGVNKAISKELKRTKDASKFAVDAKVPARSFALRALGVTLQQAYSMHLQKTWLFTDTLREDKWLLPQCRCGQAVDKWAAGHTHCAACSAYLYAFPHDNAQALRQVVELVTGFPVELGAQKVRPPPPFAGLAHRSLTSPRCFDQVSELHCTAAAASASAAAPLIEQPWSFAKPFQLFFSPTHHMNVLVQDKKTGAALCLVSVETPSTVQPVRALMLGLQDGYSRAVLQPDKKLEKNAKGIQRLSVVLFATTHMAVSEVFALLKVVRGLLRVLWMLRSHSNVLFWFLQTELNLGDAVMSDVGVELSDQLADFEQKVGCFAARECTHADHARRRWRATSSSACCTRGRARARSRSSTTTRRAARPTTTSCVCWAPP